ncbi:putative alpha-mannosidase [Kockovaella imperatae]|uniref:Alpha-mannosidase n=1 Tax=Kockovaella imperatae TaxID=4999 RepID=A0A1Y1UEB3_9TREE|nr:putative alpha-mannosidase [Kockovaella imperatae]ORX36383.1 putative alpha-mannosidase [Kockovaella imperatae]
MAYSRKTYESQVWGNGVKHLKDVHGRMAHFIGGNFADYNLSSVLWTHRIDDRKHVNVSVWSAPGHSKPPFSEAINQKYKPTQKGDDFGPAWTNHWFKISLNIPKEWDHYERISFEFDCSGEGLIYTPDGLVLHGLTGGADPGMRRAEYIIPPEARKRGTLDLVIESSCNEMFGQSRDELGKSDPNRRYKLVTADLVVPNMEAHKLMYDFKALWELTQIIPSDSPLSRKAEWTANEIMNVFDANDLSTLAKGRRIAQQVLGEGWEKQIAKESENAKEQNGTVWALGHCHIDTAWLWPFSVTQQKSARSWSAQLDIMDRYPELHFSVTQAQQYEWLEELYPDLFERIKEKVKTGQFQPVGCTWVEMDTNMASGEALCRQFLYGQRYFESRFGFRSGTCVLPDTFGFNAQMPQIIRLAGAQDFFTIKLAWNAINPYVNSTYNWVGLDGSQVLSHIAPDNNYGARADFTSIKASMTGHKNLDVTDQAIYLYGNGDGGGGPQDLMMESLRRARAVGKSSDAGGQFPLVKMGGSFGEFFDAVRAQTQNGATLPNWKGEQYLELHRGCYTSHGIIKKGNRKSELHLQQAEYAATMASFADKSYKYPFEVIDRAWKDTLLCQFHDVLPGSGIAMIYDDAQAKYERIAKDLNEVIAKAYKVLYAASTSDLASVKRISEDSLFAVNTLPGQARQEVIAVPCGPNSALASVVSQYNRATETGYVVVKSDEQNIADIRAVTLDKKVRSSVFATQTGVDVFELNNETLKVTIKDGRLTSLYDTVSERELIPHGQTGGFVIMEDLPNDYDAWEVESFHLQKQRHLKFEDVRILENGPVRTTLGGSIYLDKTQIEVEISLDGVNATSSSDSRGMVRFKAFIDWKQAHQFLKFELPVDIRSDNATYDIQFGTIQRATHRNTGWEQARFEVCAHKFGDLSEYGYGVAIINDSKYGYAVDGNVMRLSLLRSPKNPDPACDMHKHEINWAIYPHVGTFAESDVTQAANAFNAPLSLRSMTSDSASIHTLVSGTPITIQGARNVFLETIKRGEQDRDGKSDSIIVRLYEKLGGQGRSTLVVDPSLNVEKAELVNILEDNLENLEHVQSSKNGGATEIPLQFRPYEIKTVRLTLGPSSNVRGGARKDTSIQADGWIEL